MNIKKEFVFGIVTIILVFIVIFFSTNKFKNQQEKSNSALLNKNDSKILLTKEELNKHNSHKDCWLLINNKLYDVTDYLISHPGGAQLITPYCGEESTEAFDTKGGKGSHSNKAVEDLKNYFIGDLNEK